jgi:SAM-dependent methyltransferase
MTNFDDYRNYWNDLATRATPQGAVTHLTPEQYIEYYIPILRDLAPAKVRKVFDVGCGAGMLVPVIQKLWPKAKYIGYDISWVMIESDKAKYPELEWVLLEEFKLPARAADFIIFHSVLTHVYEDDARFYLSTIRGALRAGGRASVSIHINSAKGYQGGIGRVDIEPAYFVTMLESLGLRVIDYRDGIQRYYAVEAV